jgi:hypothetical protein
MFAVPEWLPPQAVSILISSAAANDADATSPTAAATMVFEIDVMFFLSLVDSLCSTRTSQCWAWQSPLSCEKIMEYTPYYVDSNFHLH